MLIKEEMMILSVWLMHSSPNLWKTMAFTFFVMTCLVSWSRGCASFSFRYGYRLKILRLMKYYCTVLMTAPRIR
jgi:hypothetical protein